MVVAAEAVIVSHRLAVRIEIEKAITPAMHVIEAKAGCKFEEYIRSFCRSHNDCVMPDHRRDARPRRCCRSQTLAVP
jgi:hypothetical protein